MSFPLMPSPRPQTFASGRLSLVGSISGAFTTHVISMGPSSGHRTIVFVATGTSGSAIANWNPPTINGNAMTQVVQDGATGGDDGQKGAIWVYKLSAGESCTLAGSLPSFQIGRVFVMTGVRNPETNFVTRVGSGSIVTAKPSCCIYYGADNFGSLTSITNMVVDHYGSNHIGYDLETDANPMTYTITGSSLYLNRFVAWPFDY